MCKNYLPWLLLEPAPVTAVSSSIFFFLIYRKTGRKREREGKEGMKENQKKEKENREGEDCSSKRGTLFLAFHLEGSPTPDAQN